MSEQGMRAVADIFAAMQKLRIDLLGSQDRQDMELAQLLNTGKDAMTERFCEIILEE